jgi:ribosomal protein S18 acetylase RimI-like enzyme
MTARVTTRPATEADLPFFARVYAGTRAEELAVVPFSDDERAAFLAQQFAAQTAHYATYYADAAFDVIVIDGEDAGRLIVHRGADDLRIVDIALLPAFRATGAGTALLRELLDEAAAGGVKASIHVERENPARSLYERLGFERVSDHGIYLKMERSPHVRC